MFFFILTTTESRAKMCRHYLHLAPPPPPPHKKIMIKKTHTHTQVVGCFPWIHCLMFLLLVCRSAVFGHSFAHELRCVIASFTIILTRKTRLEALKASFKCIARRTLKQAIKVLPDAL